MADRPDFHVITGGPGSGKSTLIEALAVEGFDHMPEAGRAIIRDQVAIGGAALPWADRAAFPELMLGWELRSWHEAHDRAGPVICDRSVPDVAGYLRLFGLPVTAHVSHAAEIRRASCGEQRGSYVWVVVVAGYFNKTTAPKHICQPTRDTN